MKESLQIAIEEFRVMHAQILARINRQQHLIATGAILGAAIFTFMAAIIIIKNGVGVNQKFTTYLLLILTFPFYTLSWAYSYDDYMIGVTANFLHTKLRPIICMLTKKDDILLNESHFTKAREKKQFIGWISYHLVFLMFPILLLTAYVVAIITNVYRPIKYDIFLQAFLLLVNLILTYFSIRWSKIGEDSIRKATIEE